MSPRESSAGVPAGGERQVRSVRRHHVIAALIALLLALVAGFLLAQKAGVPAEQGVTTSVHP